MQRLKEQPFYVCFLFFSFLFFSFLFFSFLFFSFLFFSFLFFSFLSFPFLSFPSLSFPSLSFPSLPFLFVSFLLTINQTKPNQTKPLQTKQTNSQQFSSLILKFSKCCAGCRRIIGGDDLPVSIEQGKGKAKAVCFSSSPPPFSSLFRFPFLPPSFPPSSHPFLLQAQRSYKLIVKKEDIMAIKTELARHLPIFLFHPAGNSPPPLVSFLFSFSL